MTPLEFLNEEFENVSLALRETLRHDYGPRLSESYYKECELRLKNIRTNIDATAATDLPSIRDLIVQLMRVASFVALIERSRLGEFSWAFAEELRRTAVALFSEKDLKGDLIEPIIHIISDGEGYRIRNEQAVALPSSRQRFLIISFPPSLRRHVLLHALFGHEIGHTAVFTSATVSVLGIDVVPALVASSPLKTVADMNAWMQRADADAEVKKSLAAHGASAGTAFSFSDEHRSRWLIELICDLFGILLFGPAFLAAHQTYLGPLHPDGCSLGLPMCTHPPFAVRHKMLVQVMRLLNWDSAISAPEDGSIHAAEKRCLNSLTNDPFPNWAGFFSDADLTAAISGIKKLIQPYPWMGHLQSSRSDLVELVQRLVRRNPPTLAALNADGTPSLKSVRISQTLYAGWVYWIGQTDLQTLPGFAPLNFTFTNLLCDRALLQQRAIDDALAGGVK